MDREFIEKNQIAERYMAGKLPPKGAGEFERLCRDDPAILESSGLADRVRRAVQLLEHAGQGDVWNEKPRRLWERRSFTAGLGAIALLLAGLAAWFGSEMRAREAEIASLTRLVVEQPLDAAASKRTITVEPSLTAIPSTAMFAMGGRGAEMVEMKINVTGVASTVYRVSLDRIGQGSEAVIYNALRDSNGHVRIALNSAALGPGRHVLTLEGLNWRGQPSSSAWATFEVLPKTR